jgi:hypothetical protein
MKKLCSDCGSEIKLGKEKCCICQYREANEKLVSLEVKLFDYQVISEALEIASKTKFNNTEKTKEFKEVAKNWEKLSGRFSPLKIY